MDQFLTNVLEYFRRIAIALEKIIAKETKVNVTYVGAVQPETPEEPIDPEVPTEENPPIQSDNGKVAIGLDGVSDWSISQPFINVLKTAREFEARSQTTWVTQSNSALKSGGHLDQFGNPIRIPSGSNRVGTVLLTELNSLDTTHNGRYRLTYTGEGNISLSGVQNIARGTGWIEFDFTANNTNLVLLDITSINASSPIKLVSCVLDRNREAYEAGEIFRPEWLELIKDFKLLRFMDWQVTNNSTKTSWNTATKAGNVTYTNSTPVEVMVELCNKLEVDGWFCLPHQATNDYITQFTSYVEANLKDGLTAYYEYSNEVWNWQFGQAQWANQEALKLWPGYVNQDGWMQFYGGRVAEMAQLIDTVYEGSTKPYKKVITTQTGYNGLEYPILNAPRWVGMQSGRQAPSTYVDELAVTGYFGHSLSYTEGTNRIQEWRRTLGEQGTFEKMSEALNSEIDGLVRSWSYLKPIADEAGLGMVMYEGGSHIVADNNALNQDPTLLPFLEKFHYSQAMGTLYTRAMTEFENAGGKFFNVFVEMGRIGRHGFWGARRHTLDDNPRWTAIKNFNDN